MSGSMIVNPEELRPYADELIVILRGTTDSSVKDIYMEGACSPEDLLEDLRNLTPRGIHLAEMHRQSKVEEEHELRIIADEMIYGFMQLENPSTQFINGEDGKFSVAELITDLQALTPRGREYIHLYQQAKNTVATERTRIK